MVHPVSVTRFPSFRTQTLENLSHYLWKNGFLSNPDPGESLVRGNLVMETGYRQVAPPELLQRGALAVEHALHRGGQPLLYLYIIHMYIYIYIYIYTCI